MKLTIQERIALLQILPKEGDFVTLKILQELRAVLGFSEEDYKTFEIVQENDRVSWGKEGVKEIELEIGDKAKEIIKDALSELDKNKKLQPEHFGVYEKFVQDKEDK